jgi:hypothetical protein
LKYDHTGEMLIGSYNDDDVYSFLVDEHAVATRRTPPGMNRLRAQSMGQTDTESEAPPPSTGYYRKYSGHRNNNTVKQVVFMGGRSDFVISGSDCGHLFIWDTHTAEVVQMLKADEVGAINCLAPHPTLPLLATSGLENDAKVWYPSGEHKPIAEGTEKKKILRQTASSNAERIQRDSYSSSLMSLLMGLLNRGDLPLHDMHDDTDDGSEEEEEEEDMDVETGSDNGSAGSAGSEMVGEGEGEGEGEGDSEGGPYSDWSDADNDHSGAIRDTRDGDDGDSSGSDDSEVVCPVPAPAPATAPATATAPSTAPSTRRDRWTRQPAPAPTTTITTGREVGEGAADAAEDPAEVLPPHRRRRQRRERPPAPSRRQPPQPPQPDPSEHSLAEHDGDDDDDDGSEDSEDEYEELDSGSENEVTMQDIAEGRVRISLGGVDVPWSHLARLIPLLGRRRRSPSDTGDEDLEGADDVEDAGGAGPGAGAGQEDDGPEADAVEVGNASSEEL